MTTTLPTQPVEVERITYAEAFDTIAALIADGAPHPQGFAVQGYGEDPRLAGAAILTLRFDSRAALDRWACLLDFPAAESRGHHTDGHYEYTIHEAHRRWNGWSMWLRAWVHVPVPVMFDEDCATCRAFRLDGPAELPSFTCRDCGGEMTHRAGCPSEPEHLADHYAADPGLLGLDGEPRRAILEALAAGPRELSAHPAEALHAAVRDRVIYAMGRNEDGRTVYVLKSRVDVDVDVEPSRVDPEAAAQIPVLVLEVTPNPAPAPDIDDTIARLFDDDARLAVDELDDLPAVSVAQLAEAATVEPDARVYVPVPHPTGKQANAAECARLRGETSHHVPDVLPKRIPGAALAAEPVPPPSVVLTRNHPVPGLDEPTQQMPCASVPVNVELIHLAEHPVQAPVEAFHADRYDGAGSTS